MQRSPEKSRGTSAGPGASAANYASSGNVFSIELKPFGTFGGGTDISEACRLRIFYRNTPIGFRRRNGGGVFIDYFIKKRGLLVVEPL